MEPQHIAGGVMVTVGLGLAIFSAVSVAFNTAVASTTVSGTFLLTDLLFVAGVVIALFGGIMAAVPEKFQFMMFSCGWSIVFGAVISTLPSAFMHSSLAAQAGIWCAIGFATAFTLGGIIDHFKKSDVNWKMLFITSVAVGGYCAIAGTVIPLMTSTFVFNEVVVLISNIVLTGILAEVMVGIASVVQHFLDNRAV